MTDSNAGSLRVAVDIGGTFTDLAAFDETGRRISFGKALSTHHHLVDGIERTADDAGVSFRDARLFLHGSTIAINTLLERTGAETALLITQGFRDIYEIGRINRPDAYNLFFKKHDPLVRRSSRYEISERLRADGSVHQELDERQVETLADELKARGVEAVEPAEAAQQVVRDAGDVVAEQVQRFVVGDAAATALVDQAADAQRPERLGVLVGVRDEAFLGFQLFKDARHSRPRERKAASSRATFSTIRIAE